ncbi:hypothetical protein [Fibrobacter sp.]|uniref:hypothetical protein n=1 Tax=Fibrobacter sp. TaxID=35828 RepID=UPI00388D5961
MKTVIYAIAFIAIAAVSAYAYPPVTDDESAYLTDPCISRSVWCMDEAASEETVVSKEEDYDAAANEPEAFGGMYASDPDDVGSDMYMTLRPRYTENSGDEYIFI